MTRRFPPFRPARSVAAARAAGLALVLATGICGEASAQTTVGTSTTSTTGGLSVELNPSSLITHRLPASAGGGDFTRVATLNYQGINFEDCERDIVLDVPLVAVGTATQAAGYDLYAFAGTGCDNSTAVAPGVDGNACWPVLAGPISYNLNAGFVVSIRARDILSQATLAVKQAYTPIATTDDSVCHIQPTSAALQIAIYFVFGTTSGLASVGGEGMINVNADLAAAAPPTTLTVGIGDTILLPNWNTITDQDIVGYNVYYMPAGAPAASTVMQVCPDSGSTTTTDEDAALATQSLGGRYILDALDDGGDGGDDGGDGGGDGGDAATTTTTTTTTPSQGCYNTTTINATPIADAGVPYHPDGVDCPSPYPAGSTGAETDGGEDLSGVSTVESDADLGTSDDGSIGTISTAASIAAFVMQPRENVAPEGQPIPYPFIVASGNTATSATIENLADNVEYVVGVAATDGYGNVGALSTFDGTNMKCQWPQQVTDFFEDYASDHGLAGGSFCSLDAPGVPTGAGGSALVAGAALVFALRRRRR